MACFMAYRIVVFACASSHGYGECFGTWKESQAFSTCVFKIGRLDLILDDAARERRVKPPGKDLGHYFSDTELSKQP